MTVVFLITPQDRADAGRDFDALLTPVHSDAAALSVFDAGAARGDGVFETIGVNAGSARKPGPHLARLAASARIMDLPEPHTEQWMHAIKRVVGLMDPHRGGVIRLVITRGTPQSSPTCWITGQESPADVREREDGVSVVLLDRGWPIDIAERAPWMLAGAKTLSYAPNMAALREANRRGADDVVFTSLEGYALEGPTSSLIIRIGRRLVTPTSGDGNLPGTTQQELFDWAEHNGFSTQSRRVRADEVRQADAAWLVSSVRLVVPITAVDGHLMQRDAALSARMNDHLLTLG
ncbi:aminotransferase class IV [Paramicrobacterium chengjingii]|uniref:aminotransferase class IV n=1 Tax=Paramicrobacterium chengjingii TaxID=2769067 RepID=UPI00142162CD|nr:aminotransferase class IV [Microbacterium chengjingii]